VSTIDNVCPYGNNCIYGHVCPLTPKCFHNAQGKCRFKGIGMHKEPQHNSEPSPLATETDTAVARPALQGPQSAQSRAYTPDFDGAGSAWSDFDDETLTDPSSGGRRRVNPDIVECIQPSSQCFRELMDLLFLLIRVTAAFKA
jgi:hypothetical protein